MPESSSSSLSTPLSGGTVYADVLLPLALAKVYTFSVPEDVVVGLGPGVRVEVQFGAKKRYSGIVKRLHSTPPAYRTKSILSIIDLQPVVTVDQLRFWDWLANYYACSLGEVMNAALPANLKLSSETIITLGPLYDPHAVHLNEKEYLIVEALSIQQELRLQDVQDILHIKSVYPIIRSLLDQKIVFLKEDLQERFKARKVNCVRFSVDFQTEEQQIAAFELVKRSEHQTAVLLEYLQQSKELAFVRRVDLVKRTGAPDSAIKAMAKKGIFELYEREVSRLGNYEEETLSAFELSAQQERALDEIRSYFQQELPVLVHGVTGSGKTRVYLELMEAAIARGEQVLYLLPEIALTSQIIQRLQRVLGDQVLVYHSRLNGMERVEIWRELMQGNKSVVGPRSALLLPFKKLGLIVIDEEHDSSFKQQEPNPRYHGRDAALYLARQLGAKVVMGTATPSLESYLNAQSGKYGLVSMPERFGGLQLPEVQIVNAREQQEEGAAHPFFTPSLISAAKACLERGEQIILFQNRRGFAPIYNCPTCDWTSECIHCDVSLTYHKFHHRLRCHCCGYTTQLPEACPACGERKLSLKGTGTEKIEDELKIFLPDARIARMDLDTVRGKNALTKLIGQFENGELDVLVGTQMVTKGLDFERVGLVGIISADQLLSFPDFRASERAFQLMLQVAGRAGRKHRRGQVLIQAYNLQHPVLEWVRQADYRTFYQNEEQQRKEYNFPPFCRMIYLQLRHTKVQRVEEAAKLFYHWVKDDLGSYSQPPFEPSVARKRSYYLRDLVVRIPNSAKELNRVKTLLLAAVDRLHSTSGYSNVRVVVDVDPY
ncbi:MAG: primosomal protein N' [Bacteroidota bacterium]